MLISLLTGIAAGAVHVVGGADHLVAMAPFSLEAGGYIVREGDSGDLAYVLEEGERAEPCDHRRNRRANAVIAAI